MEEQYLIQTKNIIKFYQQQINFYKKHIGETTEFDTKINEKLIMKSQERYEELKNMYNKNIKDESSKIT